MRNLIMAKRKSLSDFGFVSKTSRKDASDSNTASQVFAGGSASIHNKDSECEVSSTSTSTSSSSNVSNLAKGKAKRKFNMKWLSEFYWLRYDKEHDRMFCTVCESAPKMAGKTDFVLSGSSSFKRESLVWHVNSKKHKDIRDAVVKPVKSGATVPANFDRIEQKQDDVTMKNMHIKFVTAYTIAIEELPFTKFKSLLDMQKLSGLTDINDTYANDMKCAEMVACIDEVMKNKLSTEMRDSMYFSVIIDAGTDVSVKENEAINVRYLKDGQPETKLLGLVELDHAHADGTVAAIKKAMIEAGFPEDNYENHLIGFCADGASVNFGARGGVQQKLRDTMPWVIPIWCLPHRLELTVMRMMKNCNMASSVMEALHLIYKTYHYSPKSRRELKSIGDELQVNVRMPTRVKGTRWTPHIRKALMIMLKPSQDAATPEMDASVRIY